MKLFSLICGRYCPTVDAIRTIAGRSSERQSRGTTPGAVIAEVRFEGAARARDRVRFNVRRAVAASYINAISIIDRRTRYIIVNKHGNL